MRLLNLRNNRDQKQWLFPSTSYAISLAFAFNGALFGGWASRIPEIKQQLTLSSQDLSLVLLCLALGAILSFPLAGRLLYGVSARRLSAITMALYGLAFITVGISHTMQALCALVFLFGGLHGAMDVSMNTWASERESIANKPLMPLFHAMFSLGAGLGAASGALMAMFDVDPALHFAALVLCLSPCVLPILANVESLPLSYTGFALLGIGYSIIMPAAFTRAASINPQHPGSAIASVATFAYGGMLIGPVLIGILADALSLRSAFVLFIVLSAFVAAVAKQLGR